MMEDPKPKKEDRRQPKSADDEIVRHTNSLPAEEFNFAEHKQRILNDPRARKVVEDFLKYRHREWELGIGS